eukprot:g16882.t1
MAALAGEALAEGHQERGPAQRSGLEEYDRTVHELIWDSAMAEVCEQTRIEAVLAQQRSFMDTWGAQLEQMLQMCVLLVPVQEEDDDKAGFWSQVVYSASDLFNLYRTVVLRSPEEIPVCEAAHRGVLAKPSKELRRARLSYMLAAFALRAIRSVQVLVEMDAFRRQGAKYALHVCTRIEVVKLVGGGEIRGMASVKVKGDPTSSSLILDVIDGVPIMAKDVQECWIKLHLLLQMLKIFLRFRMPFNFYVDEVAIEDAEPPKLLEQQRNALLGQSQNGNAEAPSEAAPSPAADQPFVGRRTGRSLKALEGKAPTSDAPKAPRPPPPRVADGLRRDCTPHTSQIAVAEVLYHSRPLIHLAMIRSRGRKSWAAWVVALLLERLSTGLLAMELRSLPNSRASLLEAAEVSRRQNQMWWALVRSPVFDRLLKRPCETLDWVLKKIPVINLFNIVELFLVLQPFYFSTSGS